MSTLYILVMTLFLVAVTLASLAHHFDLHVQAWSIFKFSPTSSSVQEKLDKEEQGRHLVLPCSLHPIPPFVPLWCLYNLLPCLSFLII